MKLLLTTLVLTIAMCAFGANPSFEAFRGTNEVLIRSNVSGNRIIIGPAQPISQTASNAAQNIANSTSNALNTIIVANDTITSNGAVAFTMTTSNNLVSTIGTSNANYVLIQSGTANNLTSTGLSIRATIGGTPEVFAIYDTNGNKFVSVKTNAQGNTLMIGTNTQGALSISNNASVTNTALISGGNAPSIYLGPGGNVGIGTNAPAQALGRD